MSNHYYSKNPEVESKPVYWDFVLKGHSLRFKTDRGVFSKKEVDFGSRLLIEAFQFEKEEGNLLDVGCGYGPIGLSLAKSYPEAFVHMVDVNQRALDLAKENAELNQVKNVKIYESDRLLQVEGNQFQAILTNPPIRAGKSVVHDIFEQSFDRLVESGELWVVIQKKQGAPSAIEKLESMFAQVEVVLKKKGYFIIKAKKVDR
ncbi:class I SAM-dependent methyltransferase [Mesobacillus maritimus]|uniref:class I SAM-dependent methyltransferase n=1 Tax=Mesobacillus maritimus TaxID=1643336 RepID=UPI00203C093D|nr:class I SAM-dependent methyltransferase [Mesobacillus maritimus]MCM3588488.1 class I SAM-dependent methyltransferase [Mesobacillus maritimus]MCM3671452.1 class I SAM-dependent methyltransferase [Mesobacillus maritimus]